MDIEAYMALSDADREARIGTLDAAALLQLGATLHNAGLYWHAHEAWEEVWLEAPREQRAFYQGLIQVAAAFVHLTRNEYPGTIKLLEEGLRKLEVYPSPYHGVDLRCLIEGARGVQARAIELGPRRLQEIDAASLPRVEFVSGPAETVDEDDR